MLKPIGKKLHYIIVGTGRCGTVSLAHLFNEIGIPCSHERIFGPNGINLLGQDSNVSQDSGLFVWANYLAAEASYMAVPFLSQPILQNAKIVHVVRNPIKVIQSFHNKLQYWHRKPDRWEKFIASHIKLTGTPLEKNCEYVIEWNKWIEEQAVGRKYIRIRIEDEVSKLLDWLHIPHGIRPNIDPSNTFEEWKQKPPPLKNPATETDLLGCRLGKEIRTLKERYGYE